MVKRYKGNMFIDNIKSAMFQAYKTVNIPKLNDISELLNAQAYDRHERQEYYMWEH